MTLLIEVVRVFYFSKQHFYGLFVENNKNSAITDACMEVKIQCFYWSR